MQQCNTVITSTRIWWEYLSKVGDLAYISPPVSAMKFMDEKHDSVDSMQEFLLKEYGGQFYAIDKITDEVTLFKSMMEKDSISKETHSFCIEFSKPEGLTQFLLRYN